MANRTPGKISSGDCVGPRRIKPTTVARVVNKPRGYTKAKRGTRRQERLGRAA